jgi:glycosyltransferase involved in cell wall biosynthesis
MASGVPVICSPAGSLEEVVGQAARLIDPLDPASIAAAMHALLDPAVAADFRARGLERAAEFSWVKAAEAVVRLYKSAAGVNN